jgi:hypothetical protein
MEFMYVKLEEYNRYYLKKTSSREMIALYNFLLFDRYMMESILFVRDWVTDSLKETYKGLCGEFAFLEKDDQNIYIESDLRDGQDDAIFVMKKDAFVKMLEEWNAIYLKKPKEATLYFDGEKITFDVVY